MSQEFEAVIGLEIHCQLATDSKIFCSCPARVPSGTSVADLTPNQNTCPICAGHPGTLPTLNQKVIEYAVRAGLGMGCKIQLVSEMSRKNYFYPDLPKGYQLSQFDHPICTDGKIAISGREVRVQRIHIEEDAGKSIHQGTQSLVNLNRAGTPLIEIVSHPDLRSAAEAAEYMRAVYSIVTALGVCDGNLQEGNFRCDANVSVRPKGQVELGTRCEIKNVNSFRFVERAIDYEILRQVAIVQGGGRVVQETRSFDSDRGRTESLRSKEDAEDYRYFPEPDLMVITLDPDQVEQIRRELPELPAARVKRYQDLHGLSSQDAELIAYDREWPAYYDAALGLIQEQGRDQKGGNSPGDSSGLQQALSKVMATLLVGELMRLRNESGLGVADFRFHPRHLLDLAMAIQKQEVSHLSAKTVLQEIWEKGGEVSEVIDRNGFRQTNDLEALGHLVEKVVAAYPSQMADYRSGKEKILGFLVGQVMKESKGKANPAVVGELIRKLEKKV
jgi:aspartyl-tRNA(Asn)/glutamyl-tRNA(Gln) amidotransferase subunit B